MEKSKVKSKEVIENNKMKKTIEELKKPSKADEKASY